MKAAIVAPSAPSTHSNERLEQYKKGLETLNSLGIETKIGKHAEDALSYVSSSVEDRILDLHQAYPDDEIKILIAITGGWNSSHLLQKLDFSKVTKPLIGYSDVSALINAIYAKTGQTQFHGPMVTWGFSQNDEMTNRSFLQAVGEGKQEFELSSFGKFDKGSDISGILVGGNLVSVRNLLGTPYEPDWNGKVFFWEETREEVYRVDRELTHFKNAGVWDKISGMIIGHLNRVDEKFGDRTFSAEEMIADHFKPYDFPILRTSLFGHAVPTNITIPVGGMVQLINGKIVLSSS